MPVLMAFTALRLLAPAAAQAQEIDYAVPLGDNVRSTTFQIIGDCGGRLLIYKASYGDHRIIFYDGAMKVTGQVSLEFFPRDVRNVDFCRYQDKVLVFFQYMKKGDLYCDAAVLDSGGGLVRGPVSVDRTVHPDRVVGDKAYALLSSEDRSRLMVFQISRDEDSLKFHLRTFLFDSSLALLQQSAVTAPYIRDPDRLLQFVLSNRGDLFFLEGSRQYEGDSQFLTVTLFHLPAGGGEAVRRTVTFDGRLAHTGLLLEADEAHQRLWLAALAYDEKRRNIEQLVLQQYDYGLQPLGRSVSLLSDSLKHSMQSKNAAWQQTFNNYELSDLVVARNGSALLVGEERYSDVNNVSRTGNMGLFELDSAGRLLSGRAIEKTQGADLERTFLSYLLVNTGRSLHFLFNGTHRVSRFLVSYIYLLTDFRYGGPGQLEQMPLMRGLNNKNRWAPRYGVQISSREVVIPYVTGSLLSFAKIRYAE